MNGQTLRDQLKLAVASGELITKQVKPVLSKDDPTIWVSKQIRRANMAGKSAAVIASLSSVENPELLERLSDVRHLAIKVQSACGVHSKNNRPVIAARRSAETVINYTNTLSSAIENMDLSNGDLERVSRELRGYLVELRSSLKALTEKAVEQKSIDTLTKESVLHFKQSARKLEREISLAQNQMAIVIDLPIVPIFNGMVTPQMLQDVGLPAENLGGYPVLLRQRLIGLDTEKLVEEGRDKEVYLEKLLARINEITNNEWEFVMDTGMANDKYRLLFYWIMPKVQLSAMAGITSGSALREWGLAF